MTEDTKSAEPSMMSDAFSDALKSFNLPHVHDVWTKAIARRIEDPDGAITSARTLLEAVCKHILDQSGVRYEEGTSLPNLYRQAAEVLEIAPTKNTQTVFSKLFEGCAAVVEGVGSLRNRIGDAHGKGKFAEMPGWRHAEFAVSLAGAMATYLLACWEARGETLAALIDRYMAEADRGEGLGTTHRICLRALRARPISKSVATKLTVQDFIEHARTRKAQGRNPATINQDFTFMGGVLRAAKTKWKIDVPLDAFEEAKRILMSKKLIAPAARRNRRPTHEEFDRIIAAHRVSDRHHRAEIQMGPVMEFAVWSGITISEICTLRWEDLDVQKRTCLVRRPAKSKRKSFRVSLVNKAWDIVQAQPQIEERIFPYNSHSASQRHTDAKRRLGITDLRFQDLKLEAISRLLESGYKSDEVARITGDDIKKIFDIQEAIRAGK